MRRREFCGLAALAATLSTSGCSDSFGSQLLLNPELDDALARFRELPGTSAYCINLETGESQQSIQIQHLSDQKFLIGSAFKTFVITKCLQDVEAGLLSLDKQVDIDDRIRVNDSPVFSNLAGKVQLSSVLDAITAYSDNTATDAAIAQVGASRIRTFLVESGMTATRIPDSIRILESYLAGAQLGVDVGWEGIRLILQGILPGVPRPAINDEVSIISTTKELASYYRRVLQGDFFKRPGSVIRFKSLHSRGNITFGSFPETPIYAKVGNASWINFHALCYAGQIFFSDQHKASFAFATNWSGPDSDFGRISNNFIGAITDSFKALKQQYQNCLKT